MGRVILVDFVEVRSYVTDSGGGRFIMWKGKKAAIGKVEDIVVCLNSNERSIYMKNWSEVCDRISYRTLREC